MFQQKDYSKAKTVTLPEGTDNPIWIVDLLKLLQAVSTSSQAKRLIEEGAVMVDGALVREFKEMVTWHAGSTIKAGKHKIYTIE